MSSDREAVQAPSRIIEAIRRVDLRVVDVDEALGFYNGVAGLEIADKSHDHAALRSPGGQPLLTLNSDGVTSPAAKRAAGLFHTAFRYPTRSSLGEALARLVAAGYRIGAGDHGVSEALYIDDPSGNGVELYWDRPRDQWPAPAPGERVRMYTEPVDLESLLREAGPNDPPAATTPAGTDIGHVHLQATDIDETVGFYRDVLGFDLMTMFANQAAFLSAQGYHHHIGANVWNSRGQGPTSREHAGLSRVVFAMTGASEMDALARRLSGSGIEPGEDNEGVTVRDPNGVELQFAVAA